ncbi:MAG: hypothetical protein U0401_00905 [Anaerolineae bacterium]
MMGRVRSGAINRDQGVVAVGTMSSAPPSCAVRRRLWLLRAQRADHKLQAIGQCLPGGVSSRFKIAGVS